MKRRTIVESISLVIIVLIVGFIAWFAYKHTRVSTIKGAVVYDLHLKGTDKTSLTISRSNTDNQPGISVFTMNVSNASARQLINDLNALSTKAEPGQGTYNCPEDDGVEFSFQFRSPNISASANATGCSWISIGNQAYWTNAHFWSDVSKAIHESYDPLVSS